MTHLILNGLIGLMLGVALHLCRANRADALRETLALRRRGEAKALLWAAGTASALMALLQWLAVIDVDDVPLLPLTGQVLAGGAIAGVSLGLAGFTPETAFAGVGGGRFTESLCAVLGCVAATFLFPWAERLLTSAMAWFPAVEKTLFRVTLDKPFLLPGGFLAQGSIGLILCAAALFIRKWKPVPPAALPETPSAPPVSVEPETVQEETVVVTLPGEEPVVVDTEEDAAPAGDDAPVDKPPTD